jgi:hypothetical protein
MLLEKYFASERVAASRPLTVIQEKSLHQASYLIALGVLLVTGMAHADAKDAVVILYAQFPDNAYVIGTGTFVDHDGLVLTADHVVHHIAISPPSTSTTGSVPSLVNPATITVFSAFLKASIAVDLTKQENVVGGQLSPSQWLDIAFIRVDLTDSQRVQLQPVDLSFSAPTLGETLYAYGPLCTTRTDDRCFQPAVTGTVLNSNPASARDYQVRDNITEGYSGGPLVNASGNIVAVGSWGDTLVSGVVVRASYIPSPYILRYFLDKVPPSSLFAAADVCVRVHMLPSLTAFDWRQLSAKWVIQSSLLQSKEQCSCCCESLDKVRNAVSAPFSTGSCVPPFCAQQRFYGLINTMEITLQTNTIDSGTVEVYRALKDTFAQIDLNQLPLEQRKQLYTTFGLTLANLATKEDAAKTPELGGALSTALAVLGRSQKLGETAQDYFTIGKLFQAAGDPVNAAAANILGTVVDVPTPVVRNKLKVNPQALRNSVDAGIQAQGALVVNQASQHHF